MGDLGKKIAFLKEVVPPSWFTWPSWRTAPRRTCRRTRERTPFFLFVSPFSSLTISPGGRYTRLRYAFARSSWLIIKEGVFWRKFRDTGGKNGEIIGMPAGKTCSLLRHSETNQRVSERANERARFRSNTRWTFKTSLSARPDMKTCGSARLQ